MAMASVVKRLENVTECAICCGDLTDARVLPCVHTFCLKCIEKWSRNKKTGEKVSCPICRKEFEIPEGGNAALPRDSFVEKLLEVKKLSTTLSQGDLVCDVCCDDVEESAKKTAKKATVYCVDCHENMCKQCCRYHEKFKSPGAHKLIDLNGEMDVDELLLKFPENMCQKHADKNLEIYCFDCKGAVCMMCYVMSHNSHKCSDIKEVAGDLEKQMSANVENFSAKVTECQTVLENIEENERKFCNSMAETEKLICERAEKLKQLIEDHKQSLLDELSVSKDKQLKQTASVRDEIERHQIVLENFIRYSNEVKQKGNACDIAKLAGELNTRAEELQKFAVWSDLSTGYNVTEVKFTSLATDDEFKSLFGNLAADLCSYFNVSGQVVHTIQSNYGAVTGIAAVNDRLYVSSTQQIAMYCPTTFQYQQDLYFLCTNCGNYSGTLASCNNCGYYEYFDVYDDDDYDGDYAYDDYGNDGRYVQHGGVNCMVGCSVNNCLYASKQNYIHKVALGQDNTVSVWTVGSNAQGLSVTSSHNLLVAMTGVNSLYEYSTDGALIRQISLQAAGISSPVCAVQLSDNHFGITHYGPAHQFSIISSDGQLDQSYHGDEEDMNNPRGIAVDEHGRVFVADHNNNRILVISRKTLSAYQLRLPDDCMLNGPCSILVDSVTMRLYIGEWNGGRVICCKI